MSRLWSWVLIGVAFVVVWPVLGAGGSGGPVPAEPGWLHQLDPTDPDEGTILVYWERYQRGELGARELVDLGTMLHSRGLGHDAVQTYRAALKLDRRLPEAWFRIGLVRHAEGSVEEARSAYKKCLKLLIGHGWCNFYLGLLEEQSGRPSKALHYYRWAFKVAPELADEDVNPALVLSDLYVGAELRQLEAKRGAERLPMGYLEPDRVAEVRSRPLPPPPPLAPTTADRGGPAPPAAAPAPASRAGPAPSGPAPEAAGRPEPHEARPSAGGAAVPIASPEALLAPLWSETPSWILALL